MLRLGIIEHLYTQPLFHRLVEQAKGVSPPFELLRSRQTGTGTLALELRQKRLDGAFLSPIDYAKDHAIYRVVQGVGAVSRGDSNTVELLFNENLRGIETLAVDVASTSEIVLAHLILKEKYGVVPRIVPVSGLGEDSLREADAILLVGDAALAMRRKSNKIDLVDEWMDLTGLPYVHGFWVTRKGGLTAPQTNYLIESAEAGKNNIENIILPSELEYIGQFEYNLNNEALDSVGELFRMAYYHGILKDIPNMAFHRVGDELLPPSVILNRHTLPGLAKDTTMKISIRVKPNARKNEVKPLGDNTFLVSVTAPPIDNKANEKMIEVLAGYFGRPKRTISILRGTTAKQKIVQIT